MFTELIQRLINFKVRLRVLISSTIAKISYAFLIQSNS